MSGFVEELIVFSSPLFGARLRSAGTVWKGIASDALKHAVDEFSLFARGGAGGMDGGAPVAKGVRRTFGGDYERWSPRLPS